MIFAIRCYDFAATAFRYFAFLLFLFLLFIFHADYFFCHCFFAHFFSFTLSSYALCAFFLLAFDYLCRLLYSYVFFLHLLLSARLLIYRFRVILLTLLFRYAADYADFHWFLILCLLMPPIDFADLFIADDFAMPALMRGFSDGAAWCWYILLSLLHLFRRRAFRDFLVALWCCAAIFSIRRYTRRASKAMRCRWRRADYALKDVVMPRHAARCRVISAAFEASYGAAAADSRCRHADCLRLIFLPLMPWCAIFAAAIFWLIFSCFSRCWCRLSRSLRFAFAPIAADFRFADFDDFDAADAALFATLLFSPLLIFWYDAADMLLALFFAMLIFAFAADVYFLAFAYFHFRFWFFVACLFHFLFADADDIDFRHAFAFFARWFFISFRFAYFAFALIIFALIIYFFFSLIRYVYAIFDYDADSPIWWLMLFSIIFDGLFSMLRFFFDFALSSCLSAALLLMLLIFRYFAMLSFRCRHYLFDICFLSFSRYIFCFRFSFSLTLIDAFRFFFISFSLYFRFIFFDDWFLLRLSRLTFDAFRAQRRELFFFFCLIFCYFLSCRHHVRDVLLLFADFDAASLSFFADCFFADWFSCRFWLCFHDSLFRCWLCWYWYFFFDFIISPFYFRHAFSSSLRHFLISFRLIIDFHLHIDAICRFWLFAPWFLMPPHCLRLRRCHFADFHWFATCRRCWWFFWCFFSLLISLSWFAVIIYFLLMPCWCARHFIRIYFAAMHFRRCWYACQYWRQLVALHWCWWCFHAAFASRYFSSSRFYAAIIFISPCRVDAFAIALYYALLPLPWALMHADWFASMLLAIMFPDALMPLLMMPLLMLATMRAATQRSLSPLTADIMLIDAKRTGAHALRWCAIFLLMPRCRWYCHSSDATSIFIIFIDFDAFLSLFYFHFISFDLLPSSSHFFAILSICWWLIYFAFDMLRFLHFLFSDASADADDFLYCCFLSYAYVAISLFAPCHFFWFLLASSSLIAFYFAIFDFFAIPLPIDLLPRQRSLLMPSTLMLYWCFSFIFAIFAARQPRDAVLIIFTDCYFIFFAFDADFRRCACLCHFGIIYCWCFYFLHALLISPYAAMLFSPCRFSLLPPLILRHARRAPRQPACACWCHAFSCLTAAMSVLLIFWCRAAAMPCAHASARCMVTRCALLRCACSDILLMRGAAKMMEMHITAPCDMRRRWAARDALLLCRCCHASWWYIDILHARWPYFCAIIACIHADARIFITAAIFFFRWYFALRFSWLPSSFIFASRFLLLSAFADCHCRCAFVRFRWFSLSSIFLRIFSLMRHCFLPLTPLHADAAFFWCHYFRYFSCFRCHAPYYFGFHFFHAAFRCWFSPFHFRRCWLFFWFCLYFRIWLLSRYAFILPDTLIFACCFFFAAPLMLLPRYAAIRCFVYADHVDMRLRAFFILFHAAAADRHWFSPFRLFSLLSSHLFLHFCCIIHAFDFDVIAFRRHIILLIFTCHFSLRWCWYFHFFTLMIIFRQWFRFCRFHFSYFRFTLFIISSICYDDAVYFAWWLMPYFRCHYHFRCWCRCWFSLYFFIFWCRAMIISARLLFLHFFANYLRFADDDFSSPFHFTDIQKIHTANEGYVMSV